MTDKTTGIFSASETEAGASGAAGVLPDTIVEEFIKRRIIRSSREFEPDQIQPASIDLRLGVKAWRIRASFLPRAGQSVASKIDDLADHQIDLAGDGALLEQGCVYLAELSETLELPKTISGTANPKSSTGRIDVFTRLVVDGTPAFDRIPSGYAGKLYAEIAPRTFPVRVRQGTRLNQLRLRRRTSNQPENYRPVLSDKQLAEIDEGLRRQNDGTGLMQGPPRFSDGAILSVCLVAGDSSNTIGYRARRYTPPIDMDRPNAHYYGDYWERLTQERGRRLILDPKEFYILRSSEAVVIPPYLAAEMVPIDPAMGEFRVHYAGFFDPGFGCSAAGGAGARAVLEVRSLEVPFVLEDRQIIGRMTYERLTDEPRSLYGQLESSNYQAQGLKLSKHFSMDPLPNTAADGAREP